MAQLENIEAIEKRKWKSADTLRANSVLASNEYFLAVIYLAVFTNISSPSLRIRARTMAVRILYPS